MYEDILLFETGGSETVRGILTFINDYLHDVKFLITLFLTVDLGNYYTQLCICVQVVAPLILKLYSKLS